MDRKTIALRLKKLRNSYKDGLPQDVFSELLEIPLSTYKSLELARAPLTIERINVLKEKVDANPTWLLYGEGAMFLTDQSIKETFIPYYNDIRASAGFGALNGEVKDPEYIQLPKSLIFGCSRIHTEAIRCSGESMNPSIKDGDIMFIDRSDVIIKDGEVYIVRCGDELYVKRLFKLPSHIIARSDNKEYPEFPFGEEGSEVLGRVIYKMERV